MLVVDCKIYQSIRSEILGLASMAILDAPASGIFFFFHKKLPLYFDNNKNVIIFASSTMIIDMTNDEGLKARVDSLMEDLNYYLRFYNHLIAIGMRKKVLDQVIRDTVRELKRLSK